MEKFDYIIVGSGSSGSVIANRLSENNKINLCVLEAGGSNQHPFIKMPAGFIKTINDKRFNWCFKTEVAKTLTIEKYCFQEEKVLEAQVLLTDICTLEDNQMIIINGHSLEISVGLMMMYCHILKNQNSKKMEMKVTEVNTGLCLFQM